MADNKVLITVVCYNTGEQTKIVLSKFPEDRNYEVLAVNDGSSDKTKEYLSGYNFKIIEHEINKGVGAAIKSGIKYGIKNGYQIMVVLAGNNKDDPAEISRLLDPILKEGYDYIQGSRFAPGGKWENLPPFRFVMVKVHAFLFSLLTGKRCTDALNGFRAYRLNIFDNPRINVWQDWLDKYELETYLHYKILKYRYKFKEVPVSKIYPRNWQKVKYSHIRPVIDWWHILRPLFFLIAGIKQ